MLFSSDLCGFAATGLKTGNEKIDICLDALKKQILTINIVVLKWYIFAYNINYI